MHKIILILTLLAMSSCTAKEETSNQVKQLDDIPVELTTHLVDKQQFIRGDEIQFLLSLGSDAYIYMYHVDVDKKITQILPNINQQSNHYSAGYFLTIPEYKDGYRFLITEPFGEQNIWIFASDELIDIDTSNKKIETIKQKIKMSARSGFGEYVLKIITMP